MSFKKFLTSVLAVIIVSTINAQITTMSFNIKCDTPKGGDDSWKHRKREVAELLTYYSPDFIGLQEAVNNQVDFLNDKLKDYAYIGFGREGKDEKSEGVQIFYDSTRFDLVDTYTFWLSETPNEVSKGWDASHIRIATYGAFLDIISGDTIHIFNCHLDNKGKIARKNAAKLLVKTIREYELDNNKVIVMGDFNCSPNNSPYSIVNRCVKDARKQSVNKPYGPKGTWNSFDTERVIDHRIDYVFTQGFTVLNYRHINDRMRNNRYPSDHLPVLVELE